jgi:hypothetical protein
MVSIITMMQLRVVRILLAVLLLPLLSAAQTNQTKGHYYMETIPVSFSICAESSRDLYVRAYRNIHAKGFEFNDIPVTGINVIGRVLGDQSVGTLASNKQIIGFGLVGDPPKTAVFSFKALKPGTVTLQFDGRFIDRLDQGGKWITVRRGEIVRNEVVVEVKECKQKVNLILFSQLSDEGVAWSGVGLVKDAIVEQDEDGVYRGSADFEFNVFNHATTDGGCVYQPHTALSQAEITGQLNEGVMTWTLTYQDARESVTATCVDTGTQTLDNLQPLSEYGPSVVTTSSSGGAARYNQSWSWPTGGEFAKYTIIVEPEEEKPVSRTGDSVAWLPDWFETVLFLP